MKSLEFILDKSQRLAVCLSLVKTQGWCIQTKHGGHLRYLTFTQHGAVSMNGLSNTMAVVEVIVFPLQRRGCGITRDTSLARKAP